MDQYMSGIVEYKGINCKGEIKLKHRVEDGKVYWLQETKIEPSVSGMRNEIKFDQKFDIYDIARKNFEDQKKYFK